MKKGKNTVYRSHDIFYILGWNGLAGLSIAPRIRDGEASE